MLLFDESKALEKSLGEEATSGDAGAVLARVMERQEKDFKAELSTKADIQALKADVLLVETNLNHKIIQVEARLEAKILQPETNMRVELHKEFRQMKIDLIKWMIGLFVVGPIGVTALILRLMVK